MGIKRVLFIVVSASWIAATFWQPMIFGRIGEMLSISTGFLALKSPEQEKINLNTGRDVEVLIDSVGIPHIYGKTPNDVAFAIGYMHAKDRYFQMEMMTRAVQGRLSELAGELTLESDKFWRPYNFDNLAKNTYKELQKEQPQVISYIDAYTEGINFYLNNANVSDKSFEYILLGNQPRAWQPHYTLLLSYYMAKILTYNNLDQNWQNHLDKAPPSILKQLYNYDKPNYSYIYKGRFDVLSDSLGNIISSKNIPEDTAFNFEQATENKGIGSNNWAIGANISKTGNAVLCNDPHLDMNLPGPWYQAHLVCNEFDVHGFTIPCSPYVISGHNKSIAWGITNAQWDMVDAYSVQLASNDSTKYLAKGVEKKFAVQIDTISIKGKEPHYLTSYWTDLGKKLSGKPLVERWYAVGVNKSVLTFEHLAKANNWDDFYNALKVYEYPAQNFVFADNNGNTGLITAGKLPYRPVDFNGKITDHDSARQTQYVPFEKLPVKLPSKDGFSGSANQKQAPTNYYLHHNWAEHYRGKRINDYFSADSTLFAVEDLMQLQMDLTDLSFDDALPLFDKYANEDERLLFKNWHGTMTQNSSEAKHYYFLMKAIEQKFTTILKKEHNIKWTPNFSNIIDYLKVNDTITIGKTKLPTQAFIHSAFDKAKLLEEESLVKKEGATYGELMNFQMYHLLLPGMGFTINDKGGNYNTLNVNSGAKHNHGSSMRTVIEMGKTPTVWTVQGGGQSGKINDADFSNQVSSWRQGKYYKIELNKENITPKTTINFNAKN